jgi:hypothetical protein
VGYLPLAVISWRRPDGSCRVLHFPKSQRLYPTPEEASAVALEQAKAWVEHHMLER